jgi:predicted DNA binding CopG/RHH family protein
MGFTFSTLFIKTKQKNMINKNEHYQNKQKQEEQKFEDFAKQKNIIRFNYTALSAPYDVKLRSGSTLMMGEIKVREEYGLSFFERNGAFLELKKIEGMAREQKKLLADNNLHVDLYYFNFCKDGIQIFQLKQPHEYKFDWEFLPINSETPHIKEWKMVSKLNNPIETIKK